MGSEAETGQAAPPARRARVPWYPIGRVPAAAAVLSPPPRSEGASGTPWAHFGNPRMRYIEVCLPISARSPGRPGFGV